MIPSPLLRRARLYVARDGAGYTAADTQQLIAALADALAQAGTAAQLTDDLARRQTLDDLVRDAEATQRQKRLRLEAQYEAFKRVIEGNHQPPVPRALIAAAVGVSRLPQDDDTYDHPPIGGPLSRPPVLRAWEVL